MSAPSESTSAKKLLAILAMMLGMLGTAGGCWGVVGSFSSSALLDVQREALEAQNTPIAAQQRELLAITQASAAKWGPYVGVVQALNLVASILLVFAGAHMWRAHARAKVLAYIACGSSLLVDLCIAGLAVAQQLELQDVMGTLTPTGADPNFSAAMAGATRVVAVFGSCFAAGWLLTKLASYTAICVVARRPS